MIAIAIGIALRFKFSGGRQFSSPKSPTSCSCKTSGCEKTRFSFL